MAKSPNAAVTIFHSPFYFRKLIKRLVSVNGAGKPGEVIKQTPFHYFRSYFKCT